MFKTNAEVLEDYDKKFGLQENGDKELPRERLFETYGEIRQFIALNINREIVICSAVKVLKDGLIIKGHRHCDCYHNLSQRNGQYPPHVLCQEGFITSYNRFVDRLEARQLQERAGIPSADKDGYRGNILYSEDLY